ncbi:hypothetical protein [Corynebacterium silvaticum]|uniref:hypothetical protein n=1 Tax=Corynebacterium silvaticum TaxID=2320431 RepID=UPI001430EB39|nr:hypothetical protein [Corynebacterium silvaticum]UXZ31723.1 hypothetical protein K3934_11310 [Corynebacterium silvaticum]UXZ33765.1 hypothetical protein K3911_11305 [Corynebacterium silvaticum]
MARIVHTAGDSHRLVGFSKPPRFCGTRMVDVGLAAPRYDGAPMRWNLAQHLFGDSYVLFTSYSF